MNNCSNCLFWQQEPEHAWGACWASRSTDIVLPFWVPRSAVTLSNDGQDCPAWEVDPDEPVQRSKP